MTSTRSSMPAPDAAAVAQSGQLAALIASEIEHQGGWLPFDRYMHLVLYAPGLGYYAAGARKFGDAAVGGDFVTAPEISSLFAQALAAQLAELFAQVPPRIVEFGAGSGALAGDVIQALAGRGVTLQSYSIVEVSSDLIERQRRRLRDAPIEWLAAPPPEFQGVMLANEVLDVMPVKIFVKRGASVFERGVTVQGNGFAFAERAAADDLAAAMAAIEAEHGALPDGYCSEVNLISEGWIRSSAQWLARGAVLIIDYGFPRREYYHPQRLMGTLMCHFRHHAHAEPLWMPGLNDVTAHVDFSAMAAAAHGAGLDVLGYTSQSHFLLNCGVLDQLQAQRTPTKAGALHRLISEAEMGELFKVLMVGRAVRGPWLGFEHGDRLHTL